MTRVRHEVMWLQMWRCTCGTVGRSNTSADHHVRTCNDVVCPGCNQTVKAKRGEYLHTCGHTFIVSNDGSVHSM